MVFRIGEQKTKNTPRKKKIAGISKSTTTQGKPVTTNDTHKYRAINFSVMGVAPTSPQECKQSQWKCMYLDAFVARIGMCWS